MGIGCRPTVLGAPQARVEAVWRSVPHITVAVAVVVADAIAVAVTRCQLEGGNGHAALVDAHLFQHK